jgi:hypothetical protein
MFVFFIIGSAVVAAVPILSINVVVYAETNCCCRKFEPRFGGAGQSASGHR